MGIPERPLDSDSTRKAEEYAKEKGLHCLKPE
jgi:hypothetical protein